MMKHSSQDGFLMVEVVFTTVIISLALVAAVGLFIQATLANGSAADYTVAANLAQKQVALLNANYTAAQWNAMTLPNNDIPWQDTNYGESVPILLNNRLYNVTTSVIACPEDASNLVEVTVNVTWTGRGATQSVQITTAFPK
ncbi:MAG TPA: type II secretion system protein [Negativicutes bacterium]|jgi:type II secretory pathway pseudopilin PulG